MTERSHEPPDADVPTTDAPTRTGPSTEQTDLERIREVVGRRGYDEAEDETTAEDEVH